MRQILLASMMLGSININAGTSDQLLQAAQQGQLGSHVNQIMNDLYNEAAAIGGRIEEIAISGKETVWILFNKAGKKIKTFSKSDILKQAAKIRNSIKSKVQRFAASSREFVNGAGEKIRELPESSVFARVKQAAANALDTAKEKAQSVADSSRELAARASDSITTNAQRLFDNGRD